ncbi:hypothetical protein B0H13DRAFT_1900492 [Mycena leptocephala]|nr:hypothetical protein B0H13DRAFT_1900492 [Mycena leptocephala]
MPQFQGGWMKSPSRIQESGTSKFHTPCSEKLAIGELRTRYIKIRKALKTSEIRNQRSIEDFKQQSLGRKLQWGMRACHRKNNRGEKIIAQEMADAIRWRCLLVKKKTSAKSETPGEAIETEDRHVGLVHVGRDRQKDRTRGCQRVSAAILLAAEVEPDTGADADKADAGDEGVKEVKERLVSVEWRVEGWNCSFFKEGATHCMTSAAARSAGSEGGAPRLGAAVGRSRDSLFFPFIVLASTAPPPLSDSPQPNHRSSASVLPNPAAHTRVSRVACQSGFRRLAEFKLAGLAAWRGLCSATLYLPTATNPTEPPRRSLDHLSSNPVFPSAWLKHSTALHTGERMERTDSDGMISTLGPAEDPRSLPCRESLQSLMHTPLCKMPAGLLKSRLSCNFIANIKVQVQATTVAEWLAQAYYPENCRF